MKINGNELKPGNIIHHKGKLWVTLKTEHVKPGKGGAYMQAELKSVVDGIKLNERFRANETVERAHIEEIPHQYLFSEGDSLTFMNTQDYEQIVLPKNLLGKKYDFLQESMEVGICFYDSEPVEVRLPKTVTLTISEADPVVKGQTATASFKPAMLSNGHKTMVPPHIASGTRVVINTEDGSYVARAKEQ